MATISKVHCSIEICDPPQGKDALKGGGVLCTRVNIQKINFIDNTMIQ